MWQEQQWSGKRRDRIEGGHGGLPHCQYLASKAGGKFTVGDWVAQKEYCGAQGCPRARHGENRDEGKRQLARIHFHQGPPRALCCLPNEWVQGVPEQCAARQHQQRRPQPKLQLARIAVGEGRDEPDRKTWSGLPQPPETGVAQKASGQRHPPACIPPGTVHQFRLASRAATWGGCPPPAPDRIRSLNYRTEAAATDL